MLYAFLKNLIHPPTRALAFPWFWPLTPLSRGSPEDFPMKINNTSQQLHTQQIHLGFRDGSFPQNRTCSRKTTHQINTWSKTLNAKQHGYWSPDRSWACVTVPRRNNHFSQPCVHMRCHTSGQGWSWLLRADVGRGNYLDTVASAWECGESNTIWTWIWSTLLHAGGGKAGRVMEYLISTDGSNTVGLIPGCRTSQPSFFFITLMPKNQTWRNEYYVSPGQIHSTGLERFKIAPSEQCQPWLQEPSSRPREDLWKRVGRKELVELFLTPSSRHVTGWQRSKNIWTLLLAPELLTVCLSPIALTPSEIHPSQPGLDVLVEIPMSVSRFADVKLYSRWKK